MEFSVTTVSSPQGHLSWIAQARRDIYYSPFQR